MRLYVGKFAGGRAGQHEAQIRAWAKKQRVGAGPVEVVALQAAVAKVREAATKKQYRDNPALVAVKVLEAAHQLIPLPAVD